jgi:hypothetical protein
MKVPFTIKDYLKNGIPANNSAIFPRETPAAAKF